LLAPRTLSHGSLRDHLNRSHKRKREEFVTYEYIRLTYYRLVFRSVGDPDPHVFGPPGSVSQEVRSRILPFSHKGVERTEIMLAKSNFNSKFIFKAVD
jgi:hypothetical protein